jgi:hypothetical protein
MKNDTERREFINNESNWERCESLVDNTLKIDALSYKGHTWTRVSVLETVADLSQIRLFSSATNSTILPVHREWEPKLYTRFTDNGMSAECIGKTAILDEIKELDRDS